MIRRDGNEAVTPDDDGDDGDKITPVYRSDLRGLRRSVVASMITVGAALLVAVWAYIREEATNEDLRDLIESEDIEEDVEVARLCVDEHLRYDQFIVMAEDLTEAGATVGTDAHLALLDSPPEDRRAAHEIIAELLPDAVRPIIEQYPPPSCDVGAARELIEEQERRRSAPPEG